MLLRLLPLAFAAAFIALFLRLGFWQLDRGEEKAALFERFEQSLREPPLALDDYAPQPRFARVSLAGEMQPLTLILDNQPLDGTPGAHLYGLLKTPGGQHLLVNRGWTALPRDRRLLPPLPEPPVGFVRITGHLSNWPRPGIRLGEIDYTAPRPWRVPYLEKAALEDALKIPLAAQILLATDAVGEGLEQRWRPQVMPPERHRGYALQWFSLAAAVFLVTAILQWRLVKNND